MGLKQFETNIETMFREELERRGLRCGIDFATEFPLRLSYIVDVAFPDRKLAIELDGEPFHSSPKAKKRDYHKNLVLENMGWEVIRFKGQEIMNDVVSCVDKVIGVVGCGRVR